MSNFFYPRRNKPVVRSPSDILFSAKRRYEEAVSKYLGFGSYYRHQNAKHIASARTIPNDGLRAEAVAAIEAAAAVVDAAQRDLDQCRANREAKRKAKVEDKASGRVEVAHGVRVDTKPLADALAGHRKLHIEECVHQALYHFNNLRLKVVGKKLSEVAPSPSGFDPNYQAKSRYRSYILTYFEAGQHPDYIVSEEKDAEAKVIADTTADANANFDAYIFKLAGKIGKTVKSAKYSGQTFQYSYLTVTCEDGEIQNWKTQTIINCSVYGKLFNQFPSRRVN